MRTVPCIPCHITAVLFECLGGFNEDGKINMFRNLVQDEIRTINIFLGIDIQRIHRLLVSIATVAMNVSA